MKKRSSILLVIACAVSIYADSYIGLSSGGFIEVFDAAGALTKSHQLTVVPAENYINVTYGDFLAGNAGNELAVLRDQGTVEYYSIDSLANGATLNAGNRLASNDIKDSLGNRTPYSITTAGNNLMTLSQSTSSYAYTYVPTTGFGTDLERSTVGSLSGGHDPYLTMSSGNFSSDIELYSMVTVAADNTLETFVWSGETSAVALSRTGYKGIGSTTGTTGVDAIITSGDQIAMLNTSSTLYFFDYDDIGVAGSIVYTGDTLALTTGSELKAIAAIPEPATLGMMVVACIGLLSVRRFMV